MIENLKGLCTEAKFMNEQFVDVSGCNLESSQTWDFRIQCLHYKPASSKPLLHKVWGIEATVNSKEENFRLFSQLRPRIQPQYTHVCDWRWVYTPHILKMNVYKSQIWGFLPSISLFFNSVQNYYLPIKKFVTDCILLLVTTKGGSTVFSPFLF